MLFICYARSSLYRLDIEANRKQTLKCQKNCNEQTEVLKCTLKQKPSVKLHFVTLTTFKLLTHEEVQVELTSSSFSDAAPPVGLCLISAVPVLFLFVLDFRWNGQKVNIN